MYIARFCLFYKSLTGWDQSPLEPCVRAQYVPPQHSLLQSLVFVPPLFCILLSYFDKNQLFIDQMQVNSYLFTKTIRYRLCFLPMRFNIRLACSASNLFAISAWGTKSYFAIEGTLNEATVLPSLCVMAKSP